MEEKKKKGREMTQKMILNEGNDEREWGKRKRRGERQKYHIKKRREKWGSAEAKK